MSTVLTKNISLPDFNKREILRYSGAKAGNEQINALIDECLNQLGDSIKPRVCYCEFEAAKKEAHLDLGFTETHSRLLIKHLRNCHKIILFAATIGAEIDRLITKYSRISPSKALIFQAIGAERIEALCDAFEAEIKSDIQKNGEKTVTRVSAGYGDIPLELQKEIFSVLNPSAKIGLSLNESLLMSPSKSVTAIMGVYYENN